MHLLFFQNWLPAAVDHMYVVWGRLFGSESCILGARPTLTTLIEFFDQGEGGK